MKPEKQDELLDALGYGWLDSDEDEDFEEDGIMIGRDMPAIRREGEGGIYESDGVQYLADLLVCEDGEKVPVPSIADGGKIVGVDEPWRDADE